MILGVDLGNYAVKTSKMITFPSKYSTSGNILKHVKIETSAGTFFIGDGSFDTEYRKVAKTHLIDFLLYAIAQSTQDEHNKVVVGLPLSQYAQDKDYLKKLIPKVNDIAINSNGRRIYIDDCHVYPEGVSAVYGMGFDGVIIDIGGRTTDCTLLNQGKVYNPFSMPVGTLNLYSDFIKTINSRYCLDLKQQDAERILMNGLYIDGVKCEFSIDVFKDFVDSLINNIRIEYSLKTQDIMLVGGGCELLQNSIIKRLPAARLIEESVFANAIGLGKVGYDLWA